jgi:uncharacterized protein
VTTATALLLVVAGFAAGLSGTIAGLASLFSYPALLAAGLPPLAANVTNTVALTATSIGAALGSRTELTGQRPTVRRFAVVVLLGGATGAALLLLTPSDAFERIVPWLIAGASIALLLQRPPRQLAEQGARAHPTHRDPWWLPLGTFAVAIYGGYFGAAAGIMMLTMFLLCTGEGLPIGNALKNVLLGMANAVAAVGFIVLSDVAWSAALPLAIGLFIGGLLGPRVVRRAPQTTLRRLIAVAGIGLAVHLAVQAYT